MRLRGLIILIALCAALGASPGAPAAAHTVFVPCGLFGLECTTVTVPLDRSGATPGTVFWLILRRGRTLAAVGAVAGLAIAYALGRVAAASVYEMRAADPMILGGAVVLLVVIALGATMIPAYRASRLDPSRTLRAE